MTPPLPAPGPAETRLPAWRDPRQDQRPLEEDDRLRRRQAWLQELALAACPCPGAPAPAIDPAAEVKFLAPLPPPPGPPAPTGGALPAATTLPAGQPVADPAASTLGRQANEAPAVPGRPALAKWTTPVADPPGQSAPAAAGPVLAPGPPDAPDGNASRAVSLGGAAAAAPARPRWSQARPRSLTSQEEAIASVAAALGGTISRPAPARGEPLGPAVRALRDAPATDSALEPAGGAHSPPPSRGSVAWSDAVHEPVRVHAEWSGDSVRIWLGVDGEAAALVPLLVELLVNQLRHLRSPAGARLLGVVCNGASVWEEAPQAAGAPPGPSDHDSEASSSAPALPATHHPTTSKERP